MSTTITAPMSVAAARRRLSDTSRMSSAEANELQQVITAFYAARPRNQHCVACSSGIWEERTTKDGDAVWCCAGCGRPSTLTSTEWWAQRQAAEAVRKVQDAAAAAAVPEPRDALQKARASRLEASSRLAKLERAQADARTALASAQVKHDGAVAAVAEAEQFAVARLAASITGTRAVTSDAPTQGAARGNLRTAEDALSAARGARSQLDDQLLDARRAVSNAEDRVRTAALRVLATETLEPLIEQAVTARSDYLESVASLGFLLRNGALPNGDARAHQLVLGADVAPAQWPEAQHTDGGMTARLAALMEGRSSMSIARYAAIKGVV